MKNKPTQIAILKNDGRLWGPLAMLKNLIEKLEANEVQMKPNKAIVLLLNDENDTYQTGFFVSGMNLSQCVSLCEISKTDLISNINHINNEKK